MFMEAMIFAIDEINANNNILPGIKLGGLGIDDCSNPAFAPAFITQVRHTLNPFKKTGPVYHPGLLGNYEDDELFQYIFFLKWEMF